MQGAVVFLTTRVWRLAAVNLFGMVLTMMGLGVFGIVPALVACLWATARLDRDAGVLVSGMWAQMRTEAVRANLLVLPQVCALAFALWMADTATGAALTLWLLTAITIAAHLLATLVVLSRFDATPRDTMANARAALALAPMSHLALVPILVACAVAAMLQPPLAVWFGLSVPALIANLLTRPTFARIPTKETPT